MSVGMLCIDLYLRIRAVCVHVLAVCKCMYSNWLWKAVNKNNNNKVII